MDFPKRKPTRLERYDYSTQGYYFVTICTHNRIKILSKIVVGQGLAPAEKIAKAQLTIYGEIVNQQLLNLQNRYKNVIVDKFVIMPDHIHLIIKLKQAAGASPCPTLSDVVCTFKSLVTQECHSFAPKLQIWQNSFYDHIIRGEEDYAELWKYIDNNPAKCAENKNLYKTV